MTDNSENPFSLIEKEKNAQDLSSEDEKRSNL